MASSTLAGVYTPVTYNKGVNDMIVARNAFIASGVAVDDSEISQALAQGSNNGDIYGYGALATDEPTYANDVTGDSITPDNIANVKMRIRSAYQTKAWGEMSLANALSGNNPPLEAVIGQTAKYWTTIGEQRVLKGLQGIYLGNKANDSADMVHNIALDDGTVTDAQRISTEAIVDAQQTAGDHQDEFTAIAMHSVQKTRLKKLKALEDVHDSSTGRLLFQSFNGMRVITDDSLFTANGSNDTIYTSILFGNGSIGRGNGIVSVDGTKVSGFGSYSEYYPARGNGSGERVLHNMLHDCFHAYGFDFTSASVSGNSPTYAELANATNWARKWQRKSVKLAFLDTHG